MTFGNKKTHAARDQDRNTTSHLALEYLRELTE